MNTKTKKIVKRIIGIAAVLIIVLTLFFAFKYNKKSYDSSDVNNFARCLSDKGGIYYGKFSCTEYVKARKLFGESFKYIIHIECDSRAENEQSAICKTKGLNECSTFEFNNDDALRVSGEMTFERLANISGCIAPEAI